MNTNRNAATTPEKLSGSVTRTNVRQRLAPRSLAASSRLRSRLLRLTNTGSATNGIQM